MPIGLGIYLGWVSRDWPAKTKIIGLAAAVGGALVGAWLGFHVTGGFVSLVTTIIGATVGGNLLLLALDMSRDQQVHDRFVETNIPRPGELLTQEGRS